MSGRDLQHELNAFLQAEFLHSLGAYRSVGRELLTIGTTPRAIGGETRSVVEGQVLDRTAAYNELLRESLHKPVDLRSAEEASHPQKVAAPEQQASRVPPRHPPPSGLRPDAAVQASRNQWVIDFYASAVYGLGAAFGESEAAPDVSRLGALLAEVHDSERQRPRDSPDDGRLGRFRERLLSARTWVPDVEPEERAAEILADFIDRAHPHALHRHVIQALVDAHLQMHEAEHLMSHTLGDKTRLRREISGGAAAALSSSVVLNTFVYVAGRVAPWIWAEDEAERDYVLNHYGDARARMTPTYCMWIGHQASLLALHRRGYAYWLLDQPARAYKDFHKLRRFVRALRRALAARSSQAPGADSFLIGLNALAEHHTGRIYRAQHAHHLALRHFHRAERLLVALDDTPEMHEPIRNSRWRVDLFLSQGKARVECGENKEALRCYLTAWRAFLELAQTESNATANFAVVDDVLGWLATIADDPDINKTELARQIEPLITQFETVLSPTHLRLLAADIMLRLGHVMYVLKLPDEAPLLAGDKAGVDHSLARICLAHARTLDPSNTLIKADLLRIDRHGTAAPPSIPATETPDRAPSDLATEWFTGGSHFEEAARAIDYVLQLWLAHAPPAELGWRTNVARELLASFLAHTDSINVKLAQVYRYLMQPARRDGEQVASGAAVLDLVCMRRYSSFSPFLPRPSAFRVLGGGYFVQLAGDFPAEEAFGLVVDPGPDFLLNLYNCGYCLDDIHAIVVTHDHADHIAGLDPILALLGYRMQLGHNRFRTAGETGGPVRLAIVGNESVVQRYSFFNEPRRKDAVRVMSFEEYELLTKAVGGERARLLEETRVLPPPEALTISPVQTLDHVDAHGFVAQGFLVEVTDGDARSAVLFTTDTGPQLGDPLRPGDEARKHSDGAIRLDEAVSAADVVVAHLSSVPLPELRALAGLDVPSGAVADSVDALRSLWDTDHGHAKAATGDSASREAGFLLRQLQFGFRARAGEAVAESDRLAVSPLGPLGDIRPLSERHLYLGGMLTIAESLLAANPDGLLIIGELREELGTFRTRVAVEINDKLLRQADGTARALTGDVGLRVRVDAGRPRVLCTTCDLDGDLVDEERFHGPEDVFEVCVKGEHEGVFYNCVAHDPQHRVQPTWLERVERYRVFGD